MSMTTPPSECQTFQERTGQNPGTRSFSQADAPAVRAGASGSAGNSAGDGDRGWVCGGPGPTGTGSRAPPGPPSFEDGAGLVEFSAPAYLAAADSLVRGRRKLQAAPDAAVGRQHPTRRCEPADRPMDRSVPGRRVFEPPQTVRLAAVLW